MQRPKEKHILEYLRSGLTCREVSQKTGYTIDSVYYYKQKHKIKQPYRQRYASSRKQFHIDPYIDFIVLEYMDQVSIKDIATFLGCSTRQVRNVISGIGAIRKSPLAKGAGEISGSLYQRYKHNAKTRDLVFSVSVEYIWDLFLKQNRFCSLSGLKLQFKTKTQAIQTASLDRIDSSLGYIEGNLQWVHKDINRMKTNLNEEYFVQMCLLIAEHKHV